MGKISEKIDEIIKKRKVQLGLIKTAKEKALMAKSKASDLRAFRSFLQNGDAAENFSEAIYAINTGDFDNLLEEYLRGLENLERKFSRDAINIAFIGKAGHGKSLVMQQISGLDSSIIPSADGNHCTGAKSIVTNIPERKIEAKITFYSNQELVEIVNKYLFSLETTLIVSPEQIPHIDPAGIYAKLKSEGKAKPFHETAITNLKKYVEHYSEYSEYLGQIRLVPQAEIEQYVAQYNHKDDSIKYYRYLGVKLADIRTHFTHDDAGKIVLVDTVGLGDTSFGLEDSMLKTAEADSDAILYMFRPDNKRGGDLGEKEISVVQNVENKVTKRYAEKMLFWVINKVDSHDSGSNVKHADALEKNLEDKDYRNAGVFNVDCLKQEEVENKLVIPLLEHLYQHLQEADQIRIDDVNTKGIKAFEEYDKICQQLENIFNGKISRDLEEKLKGKMDSAYKTGILDQLRQLHFEYWDKKDSTCVKLNTELDKKLKNMLFNVLKNNEIKPMTYLGGKTADEMYIICTNIMRTRIIDDFLSLDLCLDEIVEEMKMQVLHKLVDEDKGRLCFILPLDGMKSDEWIDSFIKKTEAETKYNLFADALKKLKEYRINVTGFLIHDVRMAISSLDTSLKGKNYESDYEIRNSEQDKEKLAEEIRRILEYKTELAHNDLAEKVQNFCVFPNRSMYAAITDFYDRMAFSKNDETKIEDVMERFYRHNIPIIWQQEFLEDDKIRSQKEQWDKITKALKSLDMKSNFIIG